MAGTDYGDSLRTTLDAARKQILDLGQSTLATRQQAAITLGHAEQALGVAESGLDRNQHDMATAYAINDVAVQGGALIRSADQLADLARTAADSASSALSVAATSIKTLANAFDSLAESIAGVNAIASNDDFGSAMARSAKKSEDVTNIADNTVEQLKASSLSANIQSAKSMAAAAAASVNTLGGEIQGLVDRAGALLGATQQRVSDSMKQRAAAAQAERAAQTTYRQAKVDSEALDDGTTTMDLVVNGGLTVYAVPPTPPGSTPPGMTLPAPPYLTATYTIPGAVTDRCYFFALPESDAAGFSFNDAKTAVIEWEPKESRSSFTGWWPTHGHRTGGDSSTQTYTVYIATSQSKPGDKPDQTTHVNIAVGQSYRVFAYRVPQTGAYATNAGELSSPSRPVEVKKPIPNRDKYNIDVKFPSSVLFSVEVTPPAESPQDSDIREYRAFLFLEDVYQAVKDDAAFLAGLFPASSYKLPDRPDSNDKSNVKSRKLTFSYQEGDTDAYGDIVAIDVDRGVLDENYEVLVMLVPKDTEAMATDFLPVLRVTPPPPAPSPTPGGPSSPASPPAPSSGGPARTATSAGKPTPESAASSAGLIPPGAGAK